MLNELLSIDFKFCKIESQTRRIIIIINICIYLNMLNKILNSPLRSD